MPDVKVTPTEVDIAAGAAADDGAIAVARALSARDCGASQSEMRFARKAYLAEVIARARLQGWNECREAAAAMIERAVEGGYPTPAERADQCEHGKFGWEDCIACYDEVLIETAGNVRNLTPSTPESDHVE